MIKELISIKCLEQGLEWSSEMHLSTHLLYNSVCLSIIC